MKPVVKIVLWALWVLASMYAWYLALEWCRTAGAGELKIAFTMLVVASLSNLVALAVLPGIIPGPKRTRAADPSFHWKDRF